MTYAFEKTSGDRSAVRKTIEMGPGETRQWRDFVASWLDLTPDDGAGYFNAVLDVAPSREDPAPDAAVELRARTYSATGTTALGAEVPSFSPEAGIVPGRAPARLAITGLRAGSDFRSSILVFLTGGAAEEGASARVSVLPTQGPPAASRRVALGRDVQVVRLSITELLGQAQSPGTSITVIVDEVSGAATVAACATVVDEKSGDSTLFTAVPLP